eukprot:6470047-Amphidinium_carterae.3
MLHGHMERVVMWQFPCLGGTLDDLPGFLALIFGSVMCTSYIASLIGVGMQTCAVMHGQDFEVVKQGLHCPPVFRAVLLVGPDYPWLGPFGTQVVVQRTET